MRDQETRRADRRLALAILFSFLLGVVCIAFAIWRTLHPWHQVPFRAVPPEMGFIAGPIFIGFGVAELVHRQRQGPQQPGFHTRSSSAE